MDRGGRETAFITWPQLLIALIRSWRYYKSDVAFKIVISAAHNNFVAIFYPFSSFNVVKVHSPIEMNMR